MHTTAVYISRMSREMAEMADKSGLAFLAYLLRMAEAEAYETGDASPDDRPLQRASSFENRAQAS